MRPLKEKIHQLILIALVGLLAACNSEDLPMPTTEPPSGEVANKIMPLGASRVAGAPPEYFSYRYDLWKRLIDGGYSFDFIGAERDNHTYPDYNGQTFDKDHEGRGGATSGGILDEVKMTLSQLTSPPDIVLFSSPGGNDGIPNYAQSVININAIIDEFQAKNPNVTIFIELPAPPMTGDQTPEFVTFYNQALTDLAAMAQQQTTATSQVLTVDMTANVGFNDSFLADDVHYNEAGAKFIADRYYEALQNVLK